MLPVTYIIWDSPNNGPIFVFILENIDLAVDISIISRR